jgi:serine/threonine protein phosphatase 1
MGAFMGKIFAIGDVHGCFSRLRELMDLINPDPAGDTVVFIGDYIDRGPNPRAVVDFVLEIKERLPHTVCLRGNHEQMFLNYYCEDREEQLFMYNGGISTVGSYSPGGVWNGGKPAIPEEHLQFFTSLDLYYETQDYLFVHAGLRPGISLQKQDREDLIWIRNKFILSGQNFGKVVVFGHTPFNDPLIEPNKIGIDTGAVYGGKLTCVELPGVKIYQV